jgi:hypothetical protein
MNRFPACIILGQFVVTGASAQSGPEEAVSGLMAAWNLRTRELSRLNSPKTPHSSM